MVERGNLLYAHNRLLRALIGTGDHPLARLAGILLLWYVPAYVICAVEGSLRITGPSIGLFQDLPTLVVFFVLIGAARGTLVLLRRTAILFEELPRILPLAVDADSRSEPGGGLSKEIEQVQAFVGLQDRKSWPWFALVLLFMSLLTYQSQIHLPLFAPAEVRSWCLWPERYPLGFFYSIAWSIFLWVLVGSNVVWYCLSIPLALLRLLRRHRSDLVVQSVAQDGTGGLSAVSTVLVAPTLALGWGMLYVAAWMVQFGVDNLMLRVGFGLYLLALTAVYVVPLISLHRTMKDAKQKELRRLAEMFQNAHRTLQSIRASSEGAPSKLDPSLLSKLEYLGHVEQLHRRAQQMPVWALDFSLLSRFCSVIVLPLVLFVTQLLTENLLTRFLGSMLDAPR